MAKKISFNLSVDSIQKAIDELNAYKNSLSSKNEIFVQRLAEVGLDTVNSIMQSIPSEEAGEYNTEVVLNGSGQISGAAIRLSGNKILFVEFSAGVRYGTQDYPLPSGAQYGAGTYPSDKGNWANPWGWWYKDENGEYKHSYGNRAYMPMYNAERAIIMTVRNIARQVFQS